MADSFVSEPLRPDKETFDPSRMALGEPGLPRRFFWKKRELEIVEVLERWKEYGDCKHGSGERYLRKHCYRLRTLEGSIIRVSFQRTFGRASSPGCLALVAA